MKYYLRLGFVLLLITAIASGVLAYINSFTQPIIQSNQIQTQVEARKEVLPMAVTFEKDSLKVETQVTESNPLKKKAEGGNDMFEYYVGKNDADDVVGYTFIASKYGYSSEIKTMVGVDKDLSVLNIKIIYQSETPGLGANCDKPDFAPKFKNKKSDQLFVDKDGGAIASITGATITTRAIANSIREGLLNLEKANESKQTTSEVENE
jgi:electron transport complex protein RnfG